MSNLTDYLASKIDQFRNTLSGLSNSYVNNYAKPAANVASQVFSPIVNTIGQGVQSGNRLSLQSNPLIQFATPQSTRQKFGITPNYFKTPQFGQDILNTGKGIATGLGAAIAPEALPTFGAFNVGMSGVGNLINKQPFFQNAPASFGQGMQFGAMLGPLSKVAEVGTRGIPLVQKLSGGNFLQRIGANLPRELATGAQLAALEGQNPVTGAIQFAPYAVMGGIGPKTGVKGSVEFRKPMAEQDIADTLKAIDNVFNKNPKIAIENGAKSTEFLRQMAKDYIGGDIAKKDVKTIANELINRINVDKGYGLMSQAFVGKNAQAGLYEQKITSSGPYLQNAQRMIEGEAKKLGVKESILKDLAAQKAIERNKLGGQLLGTQDVITTGDIMEAGKQIAKKKGVDYFADIKNVAQQPLSAPKLRVAGYDQGKPLTPAQANKSLTEWEKAINSEYGTLTQNQFNQLKAREFKQAEAQFSKDVGGVKAYKGGTIPETTSGFPGRALSSANVKDKGNFSYWRETLLRNIEDTFKNKNDGQAVKSYFHDPIIQNETKRVQFESNLKKSLTDTFNKLGIKRGSKADYAAADYIEGTKTVDQLKTEFPKQWEGIVSAAEQGRKVYKDLLSQINGELGKFGYAPIPERQNYVTHSRQIQTLMDRFGNMLNFKKDKLPTEMSAINVDTKPGRQFFRFRLQRQGGSTHEGLMTALDKYIGPASNQIFHTADIQRGRSLLSFLNKATAGTQDKALSNFNSYLGDYVNALAGKKNIIDRPFEKVFGRKILSIGDGLRKRTGANMVGANVSSALTNFIPFTQSLASTDKLAAGKGLFSAAMSPVEGLTKVDGVQSAFLTRRFPQNEMVGSTLGSNVKNAANILFKIIDGFTAKSVVAGKYFEGLQKGLNSRAAMAQADEYAARVLADRSFGQVPLIFNSKVLGAFTQFQVEVNNQVSFFMKDIPKNLGYNKAQVVSSLTQLVLYSYLFNNLFQKFVGRRPQIDPLHAGINAYQRIKNGEPIQQIADPTNQNTPVGEIVQNLPFTSTLTGGRIPIGSAVPNLLAVAQGQSSIGKEALKPLAYILPPTGGSQARKTIQGIGAYNKGYSQTDSGKVRYPIAQTPMNLVRTGLFGQYSTPEAWNYFNNFQQPLSQSQTQAFKLSGNPTDTYNQILQQRNANSLITKAKDALTKGTPLSGGEVQAASTSPTSIAGLVRSSNLKNAQVVGDTLVYLDNQNKAQTIGLDMNVDSPQLTGVDAVDKRLISSYKSSITRKENDIVTLMQIGAISQKDGVDLINKLEALKTASGGGKKPKKFTVPKPAAVKLKRTQMPKFSYKIPSQKVANTPLPKFTIPQLASAPQPTLRALPKPTFKL